MDWLRVLVCPECRGELVHVAEPRGLACPTCRLVYPIVGEVPWMIRERARPLG